MHARTDIIMKNGHSDCDSDCDAFVLNLPVNLYQ